jgi:hypothetical protein
MAHLKSTETSTDVGAEFPSHTSYGRGTVVQIKINQKIHRFDVSVDVPMSADS